MFGFVCCVIPGWRKPRQSLHSGSNLVMFAVGRCDFTVAEALAELPPWFKSCDVCCWFWCEVTVAKALVESPPWANSCDACSRFLWDFIVTEALAEPPPGDFV